MRPEDIQTLTERLRSDPQLATDVMSWVRSSDETGRDAAFVAFGGAQPIEPRDPQWELVRQTEVKSPNELFHADNLDVLRHMTHTGRRFRCIYIDPPFGTEQHFTRKVTGSAAYSDTTSGGEFLGALKSRVVLARDLLTEDGSFFLHLDIAMVAEAKLLLDEVFGRRNFKSWITRRKCSSKNFTRKSFVNVTDFVLFYSKSKEHFWNRPFAERSDEQLATDFPKVDPDSGRRFALVPLHAPGTRNGATGGLWRGLMPPKGKHWQWTPEKLDAAADNGDIYWTRNGTPRRKVWADASMGTPMTNLLLDYRDPFNQNFATTGYPTEKNIDLLMMLIEATTEPGDSVLDFYCGSGTTLDAAARLGRKWVGADVGSLAIATSQRRLLRELLTPTLPSPTSGFKLVRDSERFSAGLVRSPLSEIEFAIAQRTVDGVDAPLMVDLCEAGDADAWAKDRVRDGSLSVVGFDHHGNEAQLPSAPAIQLADSLPA